MDNLANYPLATKVREQLAQLTEEELDQLADEIEEAQLVLDNLKALQRVAWMAAVRPEPDSPILSLAKGKAGRKPLSSEQLEAKRLVIARCIWERSEPCSVSDLHRATGLARNRIASLVENHPWFERIGESTLAKIGLSAVACRLMLDAEGSTNG